MLKEKKDLQEKYTWMPSLKWMLKALAALYVLIIIFYFSLNILLKPYMRDIPKELTPWLNDKNISEKK